MTVNEYVKQWCEEDYDVRKEDFYVENAFYVANREWAIGGLKHGIFAFVVAFLSIATGDGVFGGLINAFATLGALTVCFWLYGIREYDANSMETSVALYIMTFLAFLVLKGLTSPIIHLLFAIPTTILYVYLTFVRPIKFRVLASKMKKKILHEEEEEERASKHAYAQWEAGFKSFRYGLPDGNVNRGDPLRREAEALFDGYSDNKQILKSRYRQLMKIHHPDRGGDEKLCQHIIAVYEELNKQFI